MNPWGGLKLGFMDPSILRHRPNAALLERKMIRSATVALYYLSNTNGSGEGEQGAQRFLASMLEVRVRVGAKVNGYG